MSDAGEIGMVLMLIILFIAFILAIQAFMWWKVFEKAGKKGWISLVPFYNSYTLYEISGKPGWWFALGLIPYLGGIITFVLRLIANLALAPKFGKSQGFGVGLTFLGIVFFPILGYGDAKYNGGDTQSFDGTDDILDVEHTMGGN